LTIAQGTTGTSTITVTPLNGFNSSVSLFRLGLAERRHCIIQPRQHGEHEHLDADGQRHGGNRTVTLTVTGSSGSLTKTATISLTVQSIPTLPSVWTDGGYRLGGRAGSANYATGRSP